MWKPKPGITTGQAFARRLWFTQRHDDAATIMEEYLRIRQVGWSIIDYKITQRTAQSALHSARHAVRGMQVKRQFEAIGGDFVMDHEDPGPGYWIIQFADDEPYDMGDMFNPDANPDINPNILNRQFKELEKRIESDGVWGYQAVYVDDEDEAHNLDCIWSFVGDDLFGSGYDVDLMQACIDHHTKRMTERHVPMIEQVMEVG